MRIGWTMLALAGSLAVASPARAQVAAPLPPDSPRHVDAVSGLSLDEAVRMALDRQPALRAARAGVEVAAGMRRQAGLRPNPMLSFLRQDEPGGMDSQTRVEVSWPLDLFRRDARVAAASREADAARLEADDAGRVLAAAVRAEYGAAAAAVRELEVLSELHATLARQLALVGARVDQGAAPSIERDVVRVATERLEADRLRLDGAAARALIALGRAIGLPPGEPLAIREGLEPLVRREASAALPESIAGDAGRPDLAAAATRVRAAEARIDLAGREGRVEVSLTGMYMAMTAGFPQRGFGAGGGLEPIGARFHYVGAGATVALPLTHRNQGAIAAARADRLRASADLDAARLAADAEVAAARVRDDRARRALAIYDAGARSLARQNLAVVTRTYELGRATIFDVLDEQRRLIELETAYTAALKEAYDARQELRLALGDVR